jgi:hypothetical protein
MQPLLSYHRAWLSKHPERTEAWLRDRPRDGFDVHHLDGNHSNDEPSNLALVEHHDHMDLHGFGMRRLLSMSEADPDDKGRQAYEAKDCCVSRRLISG